MSAVITDFVMFLTIFTTIHIGSLFLPNYNRLYVRLKYSLLHIDMPNVTTYYGELSDLFIAFLVSFLTFFFKLFFHQTLTDCYFYHNRSMSSSRM